MKIMMENENIGPETGVVRVHEKRCSPRIIIRLAALASLVAASLVLFTSLPAAAQDVSKNPSTSSAPAVVPSTSSTTGTNYPSTLFSPGASDSGGGTTSAMSAAGSITVSSEADGPGGSGVTVSRTPAHPKKAKVGPGKATTTTPARPVTGSSADYGSTTYAQSPPTTYSNAYGSYPSTTYGETTSSALPQYGTPYTGGISTSLLGLLGGGTLLVLGATFFLVRFALANGPSGSPGGSPGGSSTDGTDGGSSNS